jgi:hypothetical protein
MPFKSEAQRRYMHANLPEIAQRWEQEYSTGGVASQGGMKNFLGEQEMVSAPKYWQSSPDHPTTELAYITPAEKDLLVKQDLHGSLNGGVNQGPSGIMSLNGWGSYDDPSDTSRDTGMSGTATSAAETGSRNARDTRDVQAQMNTANLGPGVMPAQAQDYRNAFIAAGGGQRVNPGFFDSRNTVSPAELAAAKAYAPQAYGKTRGGGIMGFLRSGGIFGNLIRGLGQRFGLGKRYNEPTYDMSEFNNYGLGGSQTPTYYNDLDNELMLSPELDKFDANTFDDNVNLNNVASLINTVPDSTYDMAPQKFVSSQTPDNLGGMSTDKYPTPVINEGIMSYPSDLATEFQDMAIQAGAYDTPTEGLYGLNLIELNKLQNLGYNNDQIKEAVDGGYAKDIIKSINI